ncbi:DUF6310 domain-containing protein [Hyalangium rubrum]|uniref:DUF6310 domain-containing protein n=1 Tax=Hyalangium rubrum TaxID=3103134 RepID=A0ABU5H7N7_9BACT|nr:DUF6310 domain-containing protein [Hyalangium sp. s54d21]MDY7229276.1 DUF6310 domain-containing protein [Hyalangium sp. s54d21]
MRFRACIALLLVLSACASSTPSPKEPAVRSPRLANLQRAAALPWTDDGRCVAQEASQPWPVLAERCFHALDHDRIRFNDPTRRCAVASAGAAAVGIGICVLAAPEIIVGAVIVTGVVVVGVAIKEALDAYERGASRERASPRPETESATREASASRRPKPEGSPLGRDGAPPDPPDLEPRARRPECTPRRVPPKGGHPFHNECADNIPHSAFRGANVLVNGKAFDALQPATRTLWEVKTDNFDTYTDDLQDIVIKSQVPKLLIERDLAKACGFDFRVGVRSAAHKVELEAAARELRGLIVIMDWC